MQHPKKQERLFKALSRQGLTVSYNNNVYSIRLSNAPDAPESEVLLPEGLPIEGKAFKQLANLANIRHPVEGHVTSACATPDFHPGDSDVAIGSVADAEGADVCREQVYVRRLFASVLGIPQSGASSGQLASDSQRRGGGRGARAQRRCGRGRVVP